MPAIPNLPGDLQPQKPAFRLLHNLSGTLRIGMAAIPAPGRVDGPAGKATNH